jgi:hypothetical protein
MSTDEPASVNSVVGASTLIFHNSQQRDAIPYKDRTKNIISRLDADTLPGIGTKTVSFNSEKDALGYAKTASSNYAGRRRFGTALEDTQTWFQMGKANTAEGILLLIHMTQRFDTKPLSAILFELSPEHEHRCERLPVNGLFYVLTANFSVTTGEEVVFISRLPEAELLDAQTHKCGTIIEAW